MADRVYVGVEDGGLERLREREPRRVAATLAAADRVLRHQFRFLSPDFWRSADPNRAAWGNGYVPLDWYQDPVQQLRFPERVPYRDWDLYEMRPGLADIKLPWELSRCQHWAVLGQAYRLSGDERYAREIVNQLDDFVESNPVGLGVNWTCTMDVSIRAANWIIGLALIEGSTALDTEARRRAFDELFRHGQFIFGNLENVHEVTSNHFLSNLVGLFFIANLFRELSEGQRWDSFCRECLEQEIEVQVLPDGADFESSIPYHRLVTELFLGSARLAQYASRPLSNLYLDRLRTMIDYLAGVLRPDGLMPQVGDADDGRLHILTDYDDWNPQDGRHIFWPAAILLSEDRWLRCGSDPGPWEAGWWGYDVGAALRATGTAQGLPHSDSEPTAGVAVRQSPSEVCPSDHVALYESAGIVIARSHGNYLLVSNSIVGTEGFGNHKHNDLLSFEYHVGGTPLIVDPGSYVYTSDPDARNRFRSTAGHSTLEVDGQEQNEIRSEWLFRMFETAHPEHVDFSYDAEARRIQYSGRHRGYDRLDHGLVHERHFDFQLDTGRLQLRDTLVGTGQHDLMWSFHCAPGLEAARASTGGIILNAAANGVAIGLRVPHGLDTDVDDGWYSPAYGVRVPCRVVRLRTRLELTGTWRGNFSFEVVER